MAPILKFGDKYLLTAQIESIVWLTDDTVEIRTRTDIHLFAGSTASALKTYLNGLAQSFA
jgi:hypothetical protein